MKKFLLYIAASLILIATIGFSFLHISENKIKRERDKEQDLKSERENRWYTLKDSMNEYDKATAMRNQIELLQELKSDPSKIKQRNDECIVLLQHAIICAYSSALTPPTNEEIKEWKNLRTYPELWKIYYKYIKKAQEKSKELAQQIRTKKQKIINMENTSMLFFKIFLVLNSVGLLLGIISNFYDN